MAEAEFTNFNQQPPLNPNQIKGNFMKGGEPFLNLVSSEVGVLMFHGFTSTPYQFKDLAKYLTDRELSVYCPVIAGHATRPEDLEKTTAADWQKSVEDSFLKFQNQVKKIFLVGNSFGGNLAFYLAAKFANPVSGIVSLGAPITLRYQKFIKLRYYAYGWLKKYYRKPGIHYHDDYLPAEQVSYPVIPVRSLGQLLNFIKQITIPGLTQVKTPTLIIQADEDPIVHPKSAQTLHEQLGSDYKKVCWLNGRFHSLSDMQRKEEIFEKIYQFIKELS